MADIFQNKYRIPSARLQTWDYRWQGAYFITICTKNRAHYFGSVVNNKMELSNVGVLADVFWHEIKNHSKNITLGEFIVMPNHIHGILIINADPDTTSNSRDSNQIPIEIDDGNLTDAPNRLDDANCLDVANSIHDRIPVQTRHALSLPDANEYPNAHEYPQKSIGQTRFRNPGKNSISSIIGAINLP